MALLILLKALPLLFTLSWILQCECNVTADLYEDTENTDSGIRTFRVSHFNNCVKLDNKQKQSIKAPSVVWLLPLLYLGAFIVGLPANLLVLWVLVFHTKKLPSTILLLNLTVCDLLLLVVLPFRAAYYFSGSHWTFGEHFCRLVSAVFYGNIYGSVLCLMLVSLDRYMALVHPFRAKTLRTRSSASCMSLAMWVVVLVAMLPLLLSQQSYKLDDPPITMCHDAQTKEVQESFLFPYFTALFSICFMLPLLVILFCNGCVLYTLMGKRQRYARAMCITALVVVVFVVCFLPSNVILLLHYSHSSLATPDDLYVSYIITLGISCYGPCIDPFIYYYVSDEFRAKVVRVLRCQTEGMDSSASVPLPPSKLSKNTSSSSLLNFRKNEVIVKLNPSE